MAVARLSTRGARSHAHHVTPSQAPPPPPASTLTIHHRRLHFYCRLVAPSLHSHKEETSGSDGGGKNHVMVLWKSAFILLPSLVEEFS